MKVVCLFLFIQIYFVSLDNMLPFSQYSLWAPFSMFNPRGHTNSVAILNRKSFLIAFFY